MIIGICGVARSGKSVSAAILQNKLGFKEHSFAAPIREFVWKLLDVDAATFETIKDKPHPLLSGKTPRYAMQTLGTEWGRDTISQTLWIDVCIHKAKNHPGNVVISDVRFENEAAAIRNAGGIIIKIVRKDAPFIQTPNHSSEAGIPDCLVDHIIVNDSDIVTFETNLLRDIQDWMNMKK